MDLNEKQREAVEYLGGPLLVLAGPGTGKTQLLSKKVEYILENTDASPDNILCLTFTDSGVNNMRERLLSTIGPSAGSINIHTYHSFGSNILAQYKNYAENFTRNLDNPIDNVTQFKIIKELHDKLPVLDILKSADINDIISVISDAKSAKLTYDDLEKIALKNLADDAKINQKVAPILNEKLPELKAVKNSEKYNFGLENIYLPIAEILKEFASKTPITQNIMPEANELLTSLDQASQEGMTAGTNGVPSIKTLTKWKDDHFEKDKNGNYALSSRVANKKLLSISSIMRSYDKYLEENGLFDFADMIEESIKILNQDTGFKATLSERYQYILLDEFQDTNPSQMELVSLLTDYEEPFITAVGDDDQAIYEFQGANASSLKDFKTKYNAKVVVLTDNYRSTQEILDFSLNVTKQLDNSFTKSMKDIVKQLHSKNNKSLDSSDKTDQILEMPSGTHIVRHDFLSADSEFAWISNKISELIKSGVEPKDIAIITSKHKYILPILPHLKRNHINVAYEKRENILEDPRIHELTTLSRFIYELSTNSNPSHMLMEILSYDFFNIPPVEIIKNLQSSWNDKRKPLDYLIDSDSDSLRLLGYWFAELVAKSFNTPLEEMLDYLIGQTSLVIHSSDKEQKYTSPYLNYYASDTSTFSTFSLYENLSTLRDTIKSHLNTEKPRLKDLINFLDDYEIAGASILNTSPYQDSTNCVQVMTAHKSKGLEFKYVFLTSVDDLNWGAGKGNNNKLSLPKNVIQIRHTGITNDERLRLLFVAITRAKRSLVMTSSHSDFTGRTPHRLAYLAEYEDADGNLISPHLPHQEVITHYDLDNNLATDDNLHDSWVASYLNPDPNLMPILLSRVENYSLTATDLTSFIDIVYAGPLKLYETKILKGPVEPADFRITFGNLIHVTFEAVTNQKLSEKEAIEFYQKQVDALDIDKSEHDDLLSKGIVSLKASLEAFGDILRAEGSKAELSMYHNHLEVSGVPINGKIDHINIDSKNKTIEIYDFKTSSFKSQKKWESEASLYKYALQLGFYKLLLMASPEYKNYKISKAHILFVSPSNQDIEKSMSESTDNDIDNNPDNDTADTVAQISDTSNLVHDKVFEFTPQFEQDLVDLVTAVYKHIKTLDFIDKKSPLAILPDNNKTIKDIHEFVDKVKEINTSR